MVVDYETNKARQFFLQGPAAAEWLDDYVLGLVDAIDEHELAEKLGVSVTALRWGADRALAEGA